MQIPEIFKKIVDVDNSDSPFNNIEDIILIAVILILAMEKKLDKVLLICLLFIFLDPDWDLDSN